MRNAAFAELCSKRTYFFDFFGAFFFAGAFAAPFSACSKRFWASASLYLSSGFFVMDKAAVIKAEGRLRLATKHANAISACKSHDEFADTWYQFLVTYKNVYTALEQGAKASPQSRQWFGAKKIERRDDPLLQYLFQARHADEHGIESVTQFVPGSVAIGVRKPGFSGSVRINGSLETGMLVESMDGKPVLVEHTNPHSRLVAVTGRGPVVYPVPVEHQGKPLPDPFPATLAGLAVAYLSALVEDARSRAV